MAKTKGQTVKEREEGGVRAVHRSLKEYKTANDARTAELEGLIEGLAKKLEAIARLNGLKVPGGKPAGRA